MQSIEPLVAAWAAGQAQELGWDQHGAEQVGRSLDARVDSRLRTARTKSGGNGVNKPDYVLLIDNGGVRIPVMCEWKGAKGLLRDKRDIQLRDDERALLQKS